MFSFDTIKLSNAELYYPTEKTLNKTKLKYVNDNSATGNTKTIIQKKLCNQIIEYKKYFPNVKDYEFNFFQTDNSFPYGDYKNKNKDFPFSDLFIDNRLPNIFYDEKIEHIKIFFSKCRSIGILKDDKKMIVENNFADYMGLQNYIVPNNIETFIIKTQKKINNDLGLGHYMETINPFDVSNCMNLKYLIVWVKNTFIESEPISLVINTKSKIPFGTKIIILVESDKVCIIDKITTDFIDKKIKYIYDPIKTLIPEGTVDINYFEFEHLDMKKLKCLGIN